MQNDVSILAHYRERGWNNNYPISKQMRWMVCLGLTKVSNENRFELKFFLNLVQPNTWNFDWALNGFFFFYLGSFLCWWWQSFRWCFDWFIWFPFFDMECSNCVKRKIELMKSRRRFDWKMHFSSDPTNCFFFFTLLSAENRAMYNWNVYMPSPPQFMLVPSLPAQA